MLYGSLGPAMGYEQCQWVIVHDGVRVSFDVMRRWNVDEDKSMSEAEKRFYLDALQSKFKVDMPFKSIAWFLDQIDSLGNDLGVRMAGDIYRALKNSGF